MPFQTVKVERLDTPITVRFSHLETGEYFVVTDSIYLKIDICTLNDDYQYNAIGLKSRAGFVFLGDAIVTPISELTIQYKVR